jgi:hypothetical protein
MIEKSKRGAPGEGATATAQNQSLVIDASRDLVDLVKKHSGGSAESHLILEDASGKRLFVAMLGVGGDRYQVNVVRTTGDGTDNLSFKEFKDLVSQPKRISIVDTMDVEPFLRTLGIYYQPPTAPVCELLNFSGASINLSPFRDPKSDFDLLAGRFVVVKTRDADGDERFYVGKVGQQTPEGPFVVLTKGGEVSLDPASPKRSIVSIEAYAPHAQFGSKDSLVNGKPETLKGRIGGVENVFKDLFPVGTSIVIPIEYEDDRGSGRSLATLKLTAKILAYSGLGADGQPRDSMLLEVEHGAVKARVTLNVEDVVRMSLRSAEPIVTQGYDETAARAARPALQRSGKASDAGAVSFALASDYHNFWGTFTFVEKIYEAKESS